MAQNTTPVSLQVKDFAEREVLMVDYKFDQATDREGQISGTPRGGRIKIRVKALNDGNVELLNWMLNSTDPRDVTINFFRTDSGDKMKEIKGTGCYCVEFEEKWEDKVGHFEEIAITCKKIEVGPAVFENEWK